MVPGFGLNLPKPGASGKRLFHHINNQPSMLIEQDQPVADKAIGERIGQLR